MFGPHSSKIDIQRAEPELGVLIDKKIEQIKKRNAIITDHVVKNALLKGGAVDPERGRKKILAEMEKDSRVGRLKDFIEYWNKWAWRYRQIDMQWLPKTPSQLGCMERIKELCIKNDVHLDLYIGCVWKSYEKRKGIPSVQIAVSYADDIYNNNIDSVSGDLDSDAYIG